ncbi:metalloregulator ArsR/SmtB family transcription factor [Shewanella sp. AS16]|uniref:metalloregulator ArsR/SmtB family transcription factor n=1 Tax=Shewanella sp. AS16 TaxID=2907625 RepID=UPI001F39923C|nr:metalloregulator ArsR/SmtB family transcription factor [Shewanella sp. AS16]MCE9685879.1 metalloregulator ArsR/SmtB family transcription factor [Shewanella sp. AS16]
MVPTQFFKCLADDTRLRCLMLLQLQGELCVCELTSALAESQPKISRHLAQLKQCALLQDRRQGQWVFYRINPDLAPWCRAVLLELSGSNGPYIQPDLERLCQMGSRPERVMSCC